MKSNAKPLLAAIVALASVVPAHALDTINISPISDGSLYVCDGCNVVVDGAYVLASGYIQGAVKFPSSPISGSVRTATLSLNPYALPLFGGEVSVYGYGTSIAQLDISDASAGSLLGVLTLPASLGYGQDAFFDVTAFVKATNAPFLAFNLRTTGTDVFSSLEFNYGHPSQLLITTTVPEPTTPALVLSGLAVLATLAARRRSVERAA